MFSAKGISRSFCETDSPIGPPIAFSSAKIFQPPPRTPSSIPKPSRNRNTRTYTGLGSRKRARHTYDSDVTVATPFHTPFNDWSELPSASSSTYFSSAPSPPPFVNTKYELAGGLDTPSAAIEEDYEKKYQEECDQDARPNRLRKMSTATQGGFPETPIQPEDGPEHKRKRINSPDKSGWGKTIVTAVGDIAWKGINFCFSTAFRGFYAGGGKGYQLPASTPAIVEQSTWTEFGEKKDVFHESYERPHFRDSTPIPGGFPEADFHEEYMSSVRLQSQRNEYDSDGMKDSWMLVQPSLQDSPSQRRRKTTLPQPAAHKRSGSSASIAGTRSKPPTSTRQSLVTSTGSPALQSSNNSASYASPRGSPHRHSESADHIMYVRRTPSPTKPRPSMGAIVSPRRSLASPSLSAAARRRSNSTLGMATAAATASPETQKLERKFRAKERKEDESIRRLNQQLRDMIREGQQALGTKIDIEDDLDDDDDEEGDDEMDEWR